MSVRTAIPVPREHGVRASSAGPGDGPRQDGDPTGLRILLIEDSRLLRNRLTLMLSVPEVMHVADWAETESESISRIDSEEFDVLVVDVELKQGSGISVIRHARKSYAGRRQPLIVVLTNYALPTVQQRCLNAGADHFLDKMQQFDELRPIIEHYRADRHN